MRFTGGSRSSAENKSDGRVGALYDSRRTVNVGGRILDLSVPVVMGIINVTPDSFYAGSRTPLDGEAGKLAVRVRCAAEEGAALLDVGGYSSRPGATDVEPEEEFRRVAAAMEAIRKAMPEMPVSVDTFRASVVRRVTEAFGAVIVNDISAGELDAEMIPTVAELGLPYIAMHMRGTPADMQRHTDYGGDVVGEVVRYFARKVETLREAGIADVILDPGFGFAKTVEQNFELLGRMRDLQVLGCPVLAGISRKTLIWKTLDVTPDAALNGTTALHWECLRQGAAILRVHDVREAAETVRLYGKFRENVESL